MQVCSSPVLKAGKLYRRGEGAGSKDVRDCNGDFSSLISLLGIYPAERNLPKQLLVKDSVVGSEGQTVGGLAAFRIQPAQVQQSLQLQLAHCSARRERTRQ